MSIRRRSFGFRNVIILLLGDLAVFFLFFWRGRVEHQMSAGFGDIVTAGAPFAISWLVVGLLMGVYTARAVRSPAAAAFRALQTWVVAAPWAFVARSIYLETPIIFAFAGLTFSGILIGLVLWRTLYGFIAMR